MSVDIVKDRVTQIYKYLEALSQHRNPVKRQIIEQSWVFWLDKLVDYPTIKFNRNLSTEERESYIIKVKRPKLSVVTAPPDSVKDWLKHSWQDPFRSVEIIESINIPQGDKTVTIFFKDSVERVNHFDEWIIKRDLWADAERPAREAMAIYERIYDLHTRLQKESEKYRIVLGDGVLNWRRPEGGINHPILLQRIELEFDSEIPEFTFKESNENPELYGALFASLEDVDGASLAHHRVDIENKNYSPLGGESTASFFRRFISELSVHGLFIESGTAADSEGELDTPRIFRKPCIFLQDRSGGFLVAIKAILEHIEQNHNLPGSLRSIVGIEQTSIGDFSADSMQARYIEPEQVFFGKPANQEQIKVAEMLDQNWGVLVQGPPGTGKTHTIANLLGHLLANGQTVLVTSHTNKALRVLREKVAAELQPLCVSVLDRDSHSQNELKHSIESIVSQLSTINEAEYIRKKGELLEKRKNILKRIHDAQQDMIESRSSEFKSIVIGGKEYSPKDAIGIVLTGRGVNDWIPGRTSSGALLPLTANEIAELYRSTQRLSLENISSIVVEQPCLAQLPTEEALSELIETEKELFGTDCSMGQEYWTELSPDLKHVCRAHLQELLKSITTVSEEIKGSAPWHMAILQAGWKGNAHRQVWETLSNDVSNYLEKHTEFKSEIYKNRPAFSVGIEIHKHLDTVNQVIQHLNGGGSLGRIVLLTHPAWSSLRKSVKINDKNPDMLSDFLFLSEYIKLQLERINLVARWNLCMSECNGILLDEAEYIEETLPQLYPVILQKLNWYDDKWKKVMESLQKAGFLWETFLTNQQTVSGISAELNRLLQSVSGPLQESVIACINRERLEEIQEAFARIEKYLNGFCQNKAVELAKSLLKAVRNRNLVEYESAIRKLILTIELKQLAEGRENLLNKLADYAPDWAREIEFFENKQDAKDIETVENAWIWKQLNQELSKRASFSTDKIQEELTLLKAELYTINNQFISTSAWLYQKGRVKLNQRQALIGYLDVTRRIGRGTGRRVPEYLKESRRLMAECRSAVPVWIMPLTRVAETFNPATTHFDVVIIDEASQCDLMGLIAIYLGAKVVIVGDHEQVSPLSVGQNTTIVDNLISQFLQGIPNAILYDGKASVYDLARQSFGGTLRLTEHFRCVPDIIQFSNKLCYNYELKALREANSTNLKPATISHRIDGASRDGKTNEKEAIHIASLLVAACKFPQYKDKTMGVISLLGDEQGIVIERYLRNHISDKEYTDRRIICGNSAHFQGDERDVIFLSMVYSTDDPPLSMLSDGADGMYKKRFNVAASRACDQMWVVHSLNVSIDLKPGDFRRELIEHAHDPKRNEAELALLSISTESPFEKEVLEKLIQKGYKVTPQWKVGHYRIDMVVTYGDKRAAIECDGDRFHTIDQLSEDMGRQAVLERLGWKFIRIRGSQFYLEREKSMETVFSRLNELDIFPDYSREVVENSHDEMIENIIRAADLLRKEWLGTDNFEEISSRMDAGKALNPSKVKTVSILPTFEEPKEKSIPPKPKIVETLLFSPVKPKPVRPNPEYINLPSPLPLDPAMVSVSVPSPDHNDIEWVKKQGYKKWNLLAIWGKKNGKITQEDCRLAEALCKAVINETPIPIYRAVKGRKLLEQAIQQGFI